MAEYITDGQNQEVGNTIIAQNGGNNQLTADFVLFDNRRADWGGSDYVTYAVDQTGDTVPESGGPSAAQNTVAGDYTMGT